MLVEPERSEGTRLVFGSGPVGLPNEEARPGSRALRADFPLLERRLEGRPIVYLDSAATALKPRAALEGERAYATRFTANIHRGRHALGEEASDAYEGARRRVARFLGAEPEGTVFVRNTTEALNIVASGLGLSPRDTVLVSSAGVHHANLVPWMRRARVVAPERAPDLSCDIDEIETLLARHRPRVLAIGWASNVTGVIEPAAELCALARRYGAISVVDAAQAAPHLPVDVRALGCDFLALSGHKMLGPTGIGVLYGRPEPLGALDPFVVGGGVVDRVTLEGFTLKKLPYRFEAGTPHISGALGLAAALDYLEAVGLDAIGAHEALLADRLWQALADIPRTRLLMSSERQRLAVGTLVVDELHTHPDVLAQTLSDGHQIMVRSGFHCAHPLFDHARAPNGGLRASAYLYNTVEEIDRFGRIVRELLSRLVGR